MLRLHFSDAAAAAAAVTCCSPQLHAGMCSRLGRGELFNKLVADHSPQARVFIEELEKLNASLLLAKQKASKAVAVVCRIRRVINENNFHLLQSFGDPADWQKILSDHKRIRSLCHLDVKIVRDCIGIVYKNIKKYLTKGVVNFPLEPYVQQSTIEAIAASVDCLPAEGYITVSKFRS